MTQLFPVPSRQANITWPSSTLNTCITWPRSTLYPADNQIHVSHDPAPHCTQQTTKYMYHITQLHIVPSRQPNTRITWPSSTLYPADNQISHHVRVALPNTQQTTEYHMTKLQTMGDSDPLAVHQLLCQFIFSSHPPIGKKQVLRQFLVRCEGEGVYVQRIKLLLATFFTVRRTTF